jgi:hypothetical protein
VSGTLGGNQYTQAAYHTKPTFLRHGARLAIIGEEYGAELFGQRDGCGFAGVEPAGERWVRRTIDHA